MILILFLINEKIDQNGFLSKFFNFQVVFQVVAEIIKKKSKEKCPEEELWCKRRG
jgi:hypothetical protein